MNTRLRVAGLLGAAVFAAGMGAGPQTEPAHPPISADACSAGTLGTSIPVSAIGEPVSAVTLDAPTWTAATPTMPGYCRMTGSMAPVDQQASARPIRFAVVFPEIWNGRAAQLGGGGMNGIVPDLTGGGPASPFRRGFVTFGSDSGHEMRGSVDWTLNDEAIRNLGYLQLKKTHDAAMVLVQRLYGQRPRFTYFIGTSQGGREALTVAQRYPADYDGVAANVPIVGFSSLMLGPELIRIQEKPLANWVPPVKTQAIRREFMRQCDRQDGLVDGIINNYQACRAAFDGSSRPASAAWAAVRCPNGIDPHPDDASASACLTDGQIETLGFIYRRYRFATPLANGVRTFGMWLPGTDPSGSGLLVGTRFRGQEGAAPDAPMHAHLGVLGVTGFLMRDPAANPLDYVEGGPLNARREQLSAWLDSTSPDLTAFARRGGKLLVVIGTNDTLASPGEQLDYYQSVIDTMGRAAVDRFARLFVLPQTGHGLTGSNDGTDGNGHQIPVAPIPNTYDRLGVLIDWVEHGTAPGMSIVVSAGSRTLPMCSYPSYPRYRGGPQASADSYDCAHD